ncbi:MAG: zf-TFIIB domain-containing protein [Candidatus Latescibacteria bacterium]|nr:zf-TFIIB domain-containing protein [Candidatus Latescibacterota bacterium]MCK5380219.1 zf-TFIIB domain-containing protein [Candidatus Latescibacterota bacterium]
MLCPACNVEMEQLKYEGVNVDRCPSCEGVWLDSGELRLIVVIEEKTFTQEELEAAMKADSLKKEESAVCCPKCGTTMDKRESHDTIVDMCPRGDGVWLDKGELERIQIIRERLEKMGPRRHEAMEQVICFLGAMGDAFKKMH